MTNPAKTESALRALYQSSLFLKPMLSAVCTPEIVLWEHAMAAAEGVLESEQKKEVSELGLPHWRKQNET